LRRCAAEPHRGLKRKGVPISTGARDTAIIALRRGAVLRLAGAPGRNLTDDDPESGGMSI